ncbi:hypothetical protein L2E82_35118 [Cichorium intybus]|uniref:Uncharacterized protein n=1 Tax=Cichorium intybus TaxID=13427 RepID=A0ACB9BN81_CICIN|nr:hypothetical protein L2E82_35118 [Cichorium intybus]
MDVHSTNSEIIPMNQGFMANILNDDQIQTIHHNNVEMNTEFGESQDHVQMIHNDNSTAGFEPLTSKNTVVGSGSSSRHVLSRGIIAEHFNKPIKQAAKELNVGTTRLKKRCRELGIKRWPQRQIKSLQTLIDSTQEFGNNSNEAIELSRDIIPNLEKEKEAIIEGSHSGLTDSTKKLRQVAHKAAYKEKKDSENGRSFIRNSHTAAISTI